MSVYDSNYATWFLIMQFLNDGGVLSVPTDFHDRCTVVKSMVENDASGLVRSICNFGINSAADVTFHIEAPSKALSKVLNRWLVELNSEFLGHIPVGINELSKEYYKERWLGSSLCLLRIQWGTIDGFELPVALYFVDGSKVYVKNSNSNRSVAGGFEYFFDNKFKQPITGDILVQKPFGRWFDAYPSQYLVSNGAYRNFYGLQFLKEKNEQLVKKILPYILSLKKGTEGLFKQGVRYDDEDMKALKTQFEGFMAKYKNSSEEVPVYTTPFDFELKHEVPDISKMLNPELFSEANRAILASLGFVDIASASQTDRRDKALNPKPFITETQAGVKDFQGLLQEVLRMIVQRNRTKNRNLFKDVTNLKVISGSLKIYTDLIMSHLRSAFDRGVISITTYQEKMELDPLVEKNRREDEKRKGLDEVFTPHPNQYLETVEEPQAPEQKEDVDEDKKGPEANNYVNAKSVLRKKRSVVSEEEGN